MSRVVVTRAKQYPTPGRAYRFAWKWTYDYRVASGPVCQYGPGLTDLRAMLRRQFGREAEIVETWSA